MSEQAYKPTMGIIGAGGWLNVTLKPPLPPGYRPWLMTPNPAVAISAAESSAEKIVIRNASEAASPYLLVIRTPRADFALGMARDIGAAVVRRLITRGTGG